MIERLILVMPQMAQPTAAEDARLWAVAYIEFFMRKDIPESRRSRRDLERDARYMTRAVSNFALFLMDSVWLPVNFGVEWRTPWVEVDSLRRTNPGLESCLARRSRYRRLGQGCFLWSRYRLRKTAADVVGMLWVAYQAECYPELPEVYGSDAVTVMLARYRDRFSHLGDESGNA